MSEENSNVNTNANALVVDSVMNKPAKETLSTIRDLIDTGDVDVSYVAVVLKKYAKFSELLSKDKEFKAMKTELEDAIVAHQPGTTKTFHVHGAKVTLAEGGFWDYSTTEDPVLQSLTDIAKDVKALIASRQKYLQQLAADYNLKNKPLSVQEFGIKPFNVTWDDIPKLIWEDGAGEMQTNPPVKIGKTQVRMSV